MKKWRNFFVVSTNKTHRLPNTCSGQKSFWVGFWGSSHTSKTKPREHDLGVSKKKGYPQIINFNRVSIINHPFWDTTIFGNTHQKKHESNWISSFFTNLSVDF